MSSNNSAEALFQDITQFVSDSRALLEQGAILELVGLDKKVDELCEAVLKLSQDDRVRYADQLQQLFGDISQLGNALATHRDGIGKEIRGLSQHKKASTAYRNTNITSLQEEEK